MKLHIPKLFFNPAPALYRLWDHVQAHGRPPRETPEPVVCLDCRGHAVHQVVGFVGGVQPRFVLRCPRCHISFPLSLPPISGFASFTKTVHAPLSLRSPAKGLRANTTPLGQALAAFRFADPPAGFLLPQAVFALGLHLLNVPTNYRFPDSRTFNTKPVVIILERLARPAPVMYWVDAGMWQAVRHTRLPAEDLLNPEGFWHAHGAWMLPRNALCDPHGRSCPFLAFARVEPGIHDGFGIPRAIVAYVPMLHVWTTAPETMTSYTVSVTLAGAFDNLTWDREPEEKDRAFLLSLVRTVLTFNAVALARPDLAQPRSLTFPRRKQRAKGISAFLNSPWFGRRFSSKPARETAIEGDKGQLTYRLKPHWKPGWTQRYHTKSGWVRHWRPPQFINADLLRAKP